MNISEIYVVNRALDGEDIFSLPPLSELGISDFLVDAIKDGLVQKGILKDYETFTDEGVVLTRRLKLFKEAPKQVKLNNVTSLGVVNENESVLIMYNPWLDDYKIQMVDTTDAVSQLVESYDFLSNVGVNDANSDEEQPLSNDDFV
ncbi:MAG: DUF5081 family protein, partial [Actinomycetaceae bacterium]|nr:DUF5081 family protein [Actinomycetaceae bacterium]